MGRRFRRHGIKHLIARINAHGVTDVAATLTYYLVMSVFPLLLLVVTVLGLTGRSAVIVDQLEEAVATVVDPSTAQFLSETLDGFLTSRGAGIVALVSLAAALWSASNYVRAFTRALNRIWNVREGRSFIKLSLQQLLLTLMFVIGIVVITSTLGLSAPVASWIGRQIGWEQATIDVWTVVRWPLALVVVVGLLTVLFYVAPNLRRPRIRVVGPVTATVLAGLLGFGFWLYLHAFDRASSYDRTYGALAGLIIGLVFLWIINMVFLVGAVVEAEVEHLRELRQGLPAEAAVLLPPRRDWEKVQRRQTQLVEEAQQIRQDMAEAGAQPEPWYVENAVDAKPPDASTADAFDGKPPDASTADTEPAEADDTDDAKPPDGSTADTKITQADDTDDDRPDVPTGDAETTEADRHRQLAVTL